VTTVTRSFAGRAALPAVVVLLGIAVLAVAWLVRAPSRAGMAVPDAGSVSADFVDGHPVFVVHDDDGAVRVLDAVSPHAPTGLTKVLAWCATSSLFEDLWHGSSFDRHGHYLGGPAPTGMAAYEVSAVDRGRMTVGERQEAPARGGARPEPSFVPGPNCGPRTAVYGPDAVVDASVLDDLIVHASVDSADGASSDGLWYATPERLLGEVPAGP
jgi:hypothetical protein